MCFGRKSKISGTPPPPAITPRQERDTNLPTKKDLVPDDTTGASTGGVNTNV